MLVVFTFGAGALFAITGAAEGALIVIFEISALLANCVVFVGIVRWITLGTFTESRRAFTFIARLANRDGQPKHCP